MDKYLLTGLGFIAKIKDNLGTTTAFCEIWGVYHEFGVVYIGDSKPINKEVALKMIEDFRKKGWAEE